MGLKSEDGSAVESTASIGNVVDVADPSPTNRW